MQCLWPMNQNVGGIGGPLDNGYKNLTPPNRPIADCTARVSITASDSLTPPVDTGIQPCGLSDYLRQKADASAYNDAAQALKQKYLSAQHTSASTPNFESVLHQCSDTHSRRGSYDGYQALSTPLGGGGAAAALSGLINSSMEPSCSVDGSSVDLTHVLERSHGRVPIKQCAPFGFGSRMLWCVSFRIPCADFN
jgi:hypothetical protein